MFSSQWDAQTIASEILLRHAMKKPLNYTAVADDNLSLLRAACRHFGNWEAAISAAGLDYDEIRLYKVWTRTRIIKRIHELHLQGVDLSWRSIAYEVDPQLAAAATKKKHFGSWSGALEAAGFDYDMISRYKRWSKLRVLQKVRDFHLSGKRMNAKNMEAEDIALLTAARRRFASWNDALVAAGFAPHEVFLRASFRKKNAPAFMKSATLPDSEFRKKRGRPRQIEKEIVTEPIAIAETPIRTMRTDAESNAKKPANKSRDIEKSAKT